MEASTHETLTKYMETFWGIGSWNAKIWFVGIEEGLVTNKKNEEVRKEASRIFKYWNEAGRPELRDEIDFQRKVYSDKGSLFEGNKIAIQKTWRGIIAVYNCAVLDNPRTMTKESVRTFQSNDLPAQLKTGRLCIVNLLPLPANNIKQLSSLIGSQEAAMEYRDSRPRLRANELASKIIDHRPSVVVFHGMARDSEFRYITKSCGANLPSKKQIVEDPKKKYKSRNNYYFLAESERTTYVLTKHFSMGWSYEDLCLLGQIIKDFSTKKQAL